MDNETQGLHHQAELERYQQAVDAIDRCAKAGADLDALKIICRECGVDIRHTLLGDRIRITNRRHV